ncbi:unnamed protein product [Rotaria socialis]|uniref:Uncharacterized protein n=1 Tax=Rotaria socialis TaxID=392032 RepID=A0A821LAP0_9BILA|nr:unnamed protein product [Rotaria socialis]
MNESINNRMIGSKVAFVPNTLSTTETKLNINLESCIKENFNSFETLKEVLPNITTLNNVSKTDNVNKIQNNIADNELFCHDILSINELNVTSSSENELNDSVPEGKMEDNRVNEGLDCPNEIVKDISHSLEDKLTFIINTNLDLVNETVTEFIHKIVNNICSEAEDQCIEHIFNKKLTLNTELVSQDTLSDNKSLVLSVNNTNKLSPPNKLNSPDIMSYNSEISLLCNNTLSKELSIELDSDNYVQMDKVCENQIMRIN